uniref:Uncharacterized protein n=1 Tax=Acrobeloides nanus TaxID=290746 RepID=A0A914C583_9BILA
MTTFENGMGFISLLSGYVLALQLDNDNVQILWELKLNDVALKLVHCEDRLYAALANGTLAVLEKAFDRAPTALDLYHIPISAAPITDALIVDENLYLAVACKVVILNRSTLSTMRNIYVASVAAGSNTPMFEKIRQFCYSEYGIFLITAHSSLIQLWKDSECQLLFDITYDYSQRRPSFDDSDLDTETVEIYTIIFHDNQLWIGTVDGYLMLYNFQPQPEYHSNGIQPRSPSFSRRKASQTQEASFSLQKHRYPAGIRLSPRNNVIEEIPPHRQQMYYIPTNKEAEFEETARVQEIPEAEWRTRKISVVIDKLTQQYSVCVEPVASSISLDSANGTHPHNSISVERNSSSASNSNLSKSNLARRRLMKGFSVDSAVSVFSNDDTKEHNSTLSPSPQRTSFRKKLPLEQIALLKEELSIDLVDSNEYDEPFEISPENGVFPETGLAEESLGDRSPLAIQIPGEKNDEIDYSQPCSADSGTKAPLSADSTSSKNTMDELGEVLKLRRKDLDFDDTLLVAVKENDSSDEAKPQSRRMSRSFSSVEASEIKPTLNMVLQMKLKISDKPVRCIALTRFNDEDIIVTAAGNYGDEEAVLRWRRETESGLWINDPLVDSSVRRTRTLLTRHASMK